MTWYLEIDMVQEPFDNGIDPSGRARVVFNINVKKTYSNTFLEEITKILTDAGVGTYNTDIFDTSKANIPDGDGPYLSIVETGGTSPERTQNSVLTPAYPQPSAQITVRATDYVDARAMARAAYNALAPIRNVNITP